MAGMIRYMLDTNICIYLIKRKPVKVFNRFSKLKVGQICISVITHSELEFGVSNSFHVEQNREALSEFLAPIDILDYPSGASAYYGALRADLKRKGTPIGANDMLIAAHAIHSGLVLVSNNVKEFRRIKNLAVENWI
jgi:tRNA(fMet)-specific endonuclease VapC